MGLLRRLPPSSWFSPRRARTQASETRHPAQAAEADAPATPAAARRPPAREQAVLAACIHRTFAETDRAALMQGAAGLAAAALGVEFSGVQERLPERKAFLLSAGVGWHAGAVGQATTGEEPTSLAGLTLSSGGPVIADDLAVDRRLADPLLRAHRCASAVSVAIGSHAGPFGVLFVAAAAPRVFGADDAGLLQAVAGMLATALERQRALDDLRHADAALRTLMRISPVAMIELDLAGNVCRRNEAAERLLGAVRGERSGRPAPAPPDAVPDEFRALCGHAARGESRLGVPLRWHRPDGTAIDVSVSTAPVCDARGAPGGVTAVVVDVTALKQVEQAHAQLAEILESTTDFVAITEVPGRGFYLNRAGRRMLDIGPTDDVSHLTLADAYPEHTRSFMLDQVLPAAIRDGGWSGEATLMARNGQEIPVSQVILAHKTPEDGVSFFSVIARDISERKRFEAELVHLAHHDPLTNLFNRRRLEEELAEQLAQARRYVAHGALMLMDLDQFKDVNDSLGHLAGDELLVWLAGLLHDRMRDTDIIARLGGDEFAVLLPHATGAEAQWAARKLLEALRDRPITIHRQPIGVTASIGIALFPDHGTTPEEILARADIALYRAKARGRNRAEMYSGASAPGGEAPGVPEERAAATP